MNELFFVFQFLQRLYKAALPVYIDVEGEAGRVYLVAEVFEVGQGIAFVADGSEQTDAYLVDMGDNRGEHKI